MKKQFLLLLGPVLAAHAQLSAPWTFYPFAPAAGQSGSTAIYKNSTAFVAWADGYTGLVYGSNVSDNWKTPAKALGKAVGDSYDIVCLGDGGTITMTFSTPIANGDGFDFAVFENAFNDTFLELGWVEVSSDGTHFCRFPNYYGGTAAVGSYGAHSPTDIYGLASKYRQGYGTPFDLQDLQNAYDAILNGTATFLGADYAESITENFPFLDLNNIGYVRIVDIVGDGSAMDATGSKCIYDPYPTVGSAGFDLDAIGVIHQRQTPDLLTQSIVFPAIPNQRLADGSVTLSAASDSGLPVTLVVTEGPATLSGTRLTFTDIGTVVVTASQPGDTAYAPAANVVRSFVVATNVQHIYFAPVPNLCEGATRPLRAVSSQGLSVTVEVTSGDAVVGTSNVLTVGTAGFNGADYKTVTLRAYQPGDAGTAPAEDVYQDVRIVPTNSDNAPQTFAQWCAVTGIGDDAAADADGDGFNAFDEFTAGTSPTSADERPQRSLSLATDTRNDRCLVLSFRLRRRALATLGFLQSDGLGTAWTEIAPNVRSVSYTEDDGTDYVELEIELPADAPRGFFRGIFSE